MADFDFREKILEEMKKLQKFDRKSVMWNRRCWDTNWSADIRFDNFKVSESASTS
jgi:hypothetical protein